MKAIKIFNILIKYPNASTQSIQNKNDNTIINMFGDMLKSGKF